MRIAVTGATGRVGAPLTEALLQAGHHVKALSRGGPALDALARMGAEPVIGSFDTGVGDIGKLFQDADAAFLMVKTDWDNIHGHYPVVAQRFVDALGPSPVKLAVSLSAFGAEVEGTTGHSECFHVLESKLNELGAIDLVHVRAAWFMENTAIWTAPVARHGRIAWMFQPDLKMPWVATDDVAQLVARELTRPTSGHRVIREAGSEDLTMTELATIIGQEIGRPVEYRCIDLRRQDIEATFINRFGTPDRWLDDTRSAEALNTGVVRFHGAGPELRPEMPTKMAGFIRDVWKPRYLQALAGRDETETFATWSARPDL